MLYRKPIELLSDRSKTEECLVKCRRHLDSLQNISYLIRLDADHPLQVRHYGRCLDWHLRKLANAILQPPERIGVSLGHPAR